MSDSRFSLDKNPPESFAYQGEPNVIHWDTVHVYLPTNEVVIHHEDEAIRLTSDEIWTILKKLAREVGK